MTPKKEESAKKTESVSQIKNTDLLSLKKQVIEEIRNELEISKNMPPVSNIKQNHTNVLEQQKKDHKTMEPVQMKGLNDLILEESDKQSKILTQIKSLGDPFFQEKQQNP